MTVGKALAEARTRAGLSVAEISERTRIRESVILGIERDDYDACGGDLFVRGYVRVIADAVGVDAQPLISVYDETHSSGSTWYRVPSPKPEPVRAPEPEPADSDEPDEFDEAIPSESGPHTVLDLPVAAETDTSTDAEAATEAAAGAVAEVSVAEVPVPVAEAAEAEAAQAESDQAGLDRPTVNLDDTADDIPVIRLDDTVSDIEPVPAEDAPPDQSLPTEPASPAQPDLSAGEPDLSAGEPSPPPGKKTAVLPVAAPREPDMPWVLRKERGRGARGRRRLFGIGALAVVILAAVGVGVALASSSGGGSTKPPAVASSSPPALNQTTGSTGQDSTGKSAGKGGGLAGAAAGQASPKASPATHHHVKAKHAAKPAPKVAPARALRVPLAEAFGPDGTSDGDNPQSAMNVVNAKSTQPWSTDWYTTAKFGMLKQGTGLLLDMGSAVTITSVQADLGPDGGANVQVLAGNAPALSDLHLAASVDGAGGNTYFRLKTPRTARYVLIWFSKLPVSSSGQYQGSIYSVAVTGQS